MRRFLLVGFGLGSVAAVVFACASEGGRIATVDANHDDASVTTEPTPDGGTEIGNVLDAATECADGGCDAAPVCGNGILERDELCDDGDAGIGCTASCVFDPGYACDEPNKPCRRTTCNDGKREGSEACDDGNFDFGDGCTPTCRVEPTCPKGPGACTSVCGDGIKVDSEACDDGNRDDTDGCSRNCTVEPGWSCGLRAAPTTFSSPFVIRDFKRGWTVVPGGGPQSPILGGHPDFEYNAFNRGRLDPGMVKPLLGVDGKPDYAKAIGAGGTTTSTGKEFFDQWFRNVPDVNEAFLVPLSFTYLPALLSHQFLDGTFFPIDGRGFGNEGLVSNFHFTAEGRFWFVYRGGEQISGSADDDLWIYVNKHLITDLGGVHGTEDGPLVTLNSRRDELGLTLGSIYELAVFKTERKVTSSSFELFLTLYRDAISVCTR